MSFEIHVDLLVALHTTVKEAIDDGTAGSVKVKDASDVVLATIPLSYPCGTVNGTTARLTIVGGVDSNPTGGGNASHGYICDSTGKELIKLPAVAGTTPVDDCIMLDSLTVVAGIPLEMVSCTIG